MDPRKQKLLNYIVDQYIHKADPIGSREVAVSGLFDVSPATIRNEMNDLEREGYLAQPHTSAGRVPTTKGYRFYVDHILQKNVEMAREQEMLRRRVSALEKQFDQVIRATAKALAEASNEAVISAAEDEAYAAGISNLLKKPEFSGSNRAYEIAELFDNPEQYVERLPHSEGTDRAKIQVYVGDESRTGKKLNCSFVVSEFRTPSGEQHYFALLGPTRMNYKNNIRLMRYITELLSGGLLVALIFINVK